jgi:hypothetical protein
MRFIEEPNQLTIKLEGTEQLWALKQRIQIPHFAILEIDFQPQQPLMKDLWGYWRIPGTAVPWLFLAGSYRRKDEREFWYLHMRREGVLTITLKPGTLNYTKIRVSCTPEVAQSIADWWQERKHPNA